MIMNLLQGIKAHSVNKKKQLIHQINQFVVIKTETIL